MHVPGNGTLSLLHSMWSVRLANTECKFVVKGQYRGQKGPVRVLRTITVLSNMHTLTHAGVQNTKIFVSSDSKHKPLLTMQKDVVLQMGSIH